MPKRKLSFPEYWPRYNWMRQVCHNPNHPEYYNYGAKGIECHWGPGKYREFESWLLNTLGPRPSPEHCLNRKDKEKDYCPKNLEWALPKRRSRCNTCQNIFVKYRNRSQTMAAWAEELEIPYHTFRRRIVRGIPVKDIVKEFKNA